METSTLADTRCVLCGCNDVAILTIPHQGAVCLNCIKKLNTTVEELVGVTKKSTIQTGEILRVDSPAMQNASFDLPDQPWQFNQTVPLAHKKKSKPESLLKVIAGGVAGLFIGLLILHYVFKIDVLGTNFQGKHSSTQRISNYIAASDFGGTGVVSDARASRFGMQPRPCVLVANDTY